MTLPITDNHIHVNPIGELKPINTVTLFSRSGGTAMIVPNFPSWDLTPGDPLNHKKSMEITIKPEDKTNQETSVKAYAILGIHPIAFDKMIEQGYQIEYAKNIMYKELERAQNMLLIKKQ